MSTGHRIDLELGAAQDNHTHLIKVKLDERIVMNLSFTYDDVLHMHDQWDAIEQAIYAREEAA